MNGLTRRVLLLLALTVLVTVGVVGLMTRRPPIVVPDRPPAGDSTALNDAPGSDVAGDKSTATGDRQPPPQQVHIQKVTRIEAGGGLQRTRLALQAGQTIEVSCRIQEPSRLPPNARLRVAWKLAEPAATEPRPSSDPQFGAGTTAGVDSEELSERAEDAFGIYTRPTPGWSKLLHALDADLYLVYRAPLSGVYVLEAQSEESPIDLFEGSRWREAGRVAEFVPVPSAAAWPAGSDTQIDIAIRSIDLSPPSDHALLVDTEPNDTPEQAQQIAVSDRDAPRVLHVVGGSDDIEYFDNGRVGSSGDDWFRINYQGQQRVLLTACLSIPDQQVAARIRCYRLPHGAGDRADIRSSAVSTTRLLPIEEYNSGKNPNERGHQQEEQHRIAVNRWLKPDADYFLRVEANAPGYELELRVVQPAPYDEPRQAIAHGLYDHLGQVDAWLMNRPRGAAVERRIRDSGNVLGTGCMSCHTQAGVWGASIPLAMGYRPQNIQLFRNLVNICYQSMRPTNTLIDAVNNTSLPPLDLGDGPAGTRVAGHAAVCYERFRPPRKLQSWQAIRAANNVLQTADPSGVNAAGPGANVGQGVVLNYAGEVVWSAWKSTGDPKYFRALEDKTRAVLKMNVRFTDDICHRVELLTRFFPEDYVDWATAIRESPPANDGPARRVPYKAVVTSVEQATELQAQIERQVRRDLDRLRAIQNADGSWGFDPGTEGTDGQGWIPKDGINKGEPSPTALALIAFQAAGVDVTDAAVRRGVDALLQLQRPTGAWKGSSLTGFVSSGYALQALARYFPTKPIAFDPAEFAPAAGESLLETVRRVRNLSVAEDLQALPLLIESAGHPSPLVRYWAMIGLGGLHADSGVASLIKGLGDRTKLVREAAHWGLRQTLIDDHGWDPTLAAARTGDDFTRESAMRALWMRVDGVLPGISVEWTALAAAMEHALNHDPHPAVRAWSARALWNWWIWNPPLRQSINQAWIAMLNRPETNGLVENCLRYQTHALFVVNGHHANTSQEHQYRELAALFQQLEQQLKSTAADPQRRERLVRRLIAVGATFYNTAGGDGGPGQMGYATPGSGKLFGAAVLQFLQQLEEAGVAASQHLLLRVALESAAHVPDKMLQQRLIHYSLNAPEDLRMIAASSVSDPRSAQLVAVPERIEPLVRQIRRGADEPARRTQLSDPIISLFSRVRWIVPDTPEQQRELMKYLMPPLDEFASRVEIQAITDAGRRRQVERKMSANWYLAEELGGVLGSNEDLHIQAALQAIPERAANPLQARFWLPSVVWILEFETPAPRVGESVGSSPGADPSGDDPYGPFRRRALQLFLDQLTPDAHPKLRQLAVRMAHETPLRRNPRVLAALESVLDFEVRATVRIVAEHVLATRNENLVSELSAALLKEDPDRDDLDPDGNVHLPPEFLDDFRFFRDHVTREMNRPLRDDRRSCFSCHGVAGRVPTLTLKRPDPTGYLSVPRLLANYRLLQKRIEFEDVERSKLLRKPLNVQTGKEDGHQGGLRYRPNDPGYQLIRRWVRNQVQQRDKIDSGS